jgi:hypothetical protein
VRPLGGKEEDLVTVHPQLEQDIKDRGRRELELRNWGTEENASGKPEAGSGKPEAGS